MEMSLFQIKEPLVKNPVLGPFYSQISAADKVMDRNIRVYFPHERQKFVYIDMLAHCQIIAV
jgi:hypothetical protein